MIQWCREIKLDPQADREEPGGLDGGERGGEVHVCVEGFEEQTDQEELAALLHTEM